MALFHSQENLLNDLNQNNYFQNVNRISYVVKASSMQTTWSSNKWIVLCLLVSQTIIHLFLNCAKVKAFWNNLKIG